MNRLKSVINWIKQPKFYRNLLKDDINWIKCDVKLPKSTTKWHKFNKTWRKLTNVSHKSTKMLRKLPKSDINWIKCDINRWKCLRYLPNHQFLLPQSRIMWFFWALCWFLLTGNRISQFLVLLDRNVAPSPWRRRLNSLRRSGSSDDFNLLQPPILWASESLLQETTRCSNQTFRVPAGKRVRNVKEAGTSQSAD